MKSPYKFAIVYDIETGGFISGINPLMEIAACVVDLNTLSIIDRWESLVEFRLDLSFIKNTTIKKLCTDIFKYNAKSVDGVRSLNFKGRVYDKATFNEDLEKEIERFINFVDFDIGGRIITSNELNKVVKSEFIEHFTLFKNLCYTKGALGVNKIELKSLMKNGLPYNDIYMGFKGLVGRYTIGSNKPILSGHNILKFDNPFIEELFSFHKDDLYKNVSSLKLDTLELVKLRWPESDAYNLGACCQKFGITIGDAHRAMGDTEANAKLLIKLIESFRGFGKEEVTYKRRKINLKY